MIYHTASVTMARLTCLIQVVPQLAFSYDYLLHGILALSALHLSKISTGRKDMLCEYSTKHQDIGISLFRRALSEINQETCHACCAYSFLLSIHKWVWSDITGWPLFGDTTTKQESNVEWLRLVRGSGEVIIQFYSEVRQGPLAAIVIVR